MTKSYFSLFSSLLLTGLTVGLWLYSLNTTVALPSWALVLVLLAVIFFVTIGIAFAMRISGKQGAKLTYTMGILIFFVGFSSFYLFLEPTSINIFGFIAVLVGLVAANLSAVHLCRSSFLRREYSEK